MPLRYGAADPAGVLGQARAQVAALARERNLAFVAVSAPDLPATIEVDAERLGRALVNLLANAVKFTPAGGVVSATAQVSPEGGDAVIFTVRDTGPGIAPGEPGAHLRAVRAPGWGRGGRNWRRRWRRPARTPPAAWG